MADSEKSFVVEPRTFDSSAPDEVLGVLGHYHAAIFCTKFWTKKKGCRKCLGLYIGNLDWQRGCDRQTDRVEIVSSSGKAYTQYGIQTQVAKNVQTASSKTGELLRDVQLSPIFSEFSSLSAPDPESPVNELPPGLQTEFVFKILLRWVQMVQLYASSEFDSSHLYTALQATSIWTQYQAWYPEHCDSYYQQFIHFSVWLRSWVEAKAAGREAEVQLQLLLSSLYDTMAGAAEFDAAVVCAIKDVAIEIQASNLLLSQFMYQQAESFRSWSAEKKEEVGRMCQNLIPPDDNIRHHLFVTPFMLVHGAMLNIDINCAISDIFAQCAESNASRCLHQHIKERQLDGWKLVSAKLQWYSTVKDLSHMSRILHQPLCPVCSARFVAREEAELQCAADRN